MVFSEQHSKIRILQILQKSNFKLTALNISAIYKAKFNEYIQVNTIIKNIKYLRDNGHAIIGERKTVDGKSLKCFCYWIDKAVQI